MGIKLGQEFWTIVIPVVVTTAGAIIGGILTIVAGRKKATAEVQTVITDGFKDLVETLRAQVKYQSDHINGLEGDVADVQKRVSVLTKYIRDNGWELPPWA